MKFGGRGSQSVHKLANLTRQEAFFVADHRTTLWLWSQFVGVHQMLSRSESEAPLKSRISGPKMMSISNHRPQEAHRSRTGHTEVGWCSRLPGWARNFLMLAVAWQASDPKSDPEIGNRFEARVHLSHPLHQQISIFFLNRHSVHKERIFVAKHLDNARITPNWIRP